MENKDIFILCDSAVDLFVFFVFFEEVEVFQIQEALLNNSKLISVKELQ